MFMGDNNSAFLGDDNGASESAQFSDNRYQATIIIDKSVGVGATALLPGAKQYIFECGVLVSSISDITFSARASFQSLYRTGCTVYYS